MTSQTNSRILTLSEDDLRLATENLDHDILRLHNKSVLITGGTGFYGVWLCEALAFQCFRLSVTPRFVILTRHRDATLKKRPLFEQSELFDLVEADVRTYDPNGQQFDLIIHAATDSTPKKTGALALKLFETIVGGTQNILEIARRSGTKRLLYVSSCAVYGRALLSGHDAYSETDRIAPLVTDENVEYDESKRMAEALCCLYYREYGIESTIARSFPVIGPYLPLDAHFAAGNFIRNAIYGETIRISGDGAAVRSYIYMADLTRWLLTILLKGKPAYPYNVGSPVGVTIRELAELIAGSVKPSVLVDVMGRTDPGKPISRLVANTDRAAALGLQCEVGLQDAIQRTIHWYRLQG